MAQSTADVIRETTRAHLRAGGLLFGQCVTAVGWIGGTVPEMTEAEGICELPMADVAGPGIAVGAALMGKRPIYVIRYQGFMWYNAAPIVNYAAKSKELWNVPCPLFVRAIAMEGGVGPVATSSQHSMVMRMPGIPVVAPMTPGEWREIWAWYMGHDDPMYVSEHRKGFPLTEEMWSVFSAGPKPDITLFGISAARLNMLQAVERLEAEGIRANYTHIVWLKPLRYHKEAIWALKRTGVGLVIDTDYDISGASRSIAYELMHASGVPVYAMGLEDRTAGFAPHLDNGTPSAERIYQRVRQILDERARETSS